MALNPKLTNAGANAAADAVTALCNSGYIEIYDAPQPTDADTAIGAQINLATLTFGATAFGAAVAGVATAGAIGSDSAANNTGTAAWFRAFKSGHTPGSGDEAAQRVFDGSVGTSGANLNMNSVEIQAGAQVSISSLTYTQQKT